MAAKEDHTGQLDCYCGNRGTVDFWEWENPMHHGADFKSYYSSHTGEFEHNGGLSFSCKACGAKVSHT